VTITLALGAPTAAHAHGGQLLFMFLYFPHIVVVIALLVALRRWQAELAPKAVTAAAVVLASGALFATNYAIQYGTIRFRYGNGTYLLFVLAQFAIPAAVGLACWRLMQHRR